MILDQTETIAELKEKVNQFIEERDWQRYHTPKDLAISIVLEASELLEFFQWLNEEEQWTLIKEQRKLKEIESELADIVIYILSLSNILGTDLSRTILEKIRENEGKYPIDKVKGRYRKYNDIES